MVNQFDKVRGKPQFPILVLESHAKSMVRGDTPYHFDTRH